MLNKHTAASTEQPLESAILFSFFSLLCRWLRLSIRTPQRGWPLGLSVLAERAQMTILQSSARRSLLSVRSMHDACPGLPWPRVRALISLQAVQTLA